MTDYHITQFEDRIEIRCYQENVANMVRAIQDEWYWLWNTSSPDPLMEIDMWVEFDWYLLFIKWHTTQFWDLFAYFEDEINNGDNS